MPSTSLTGLLLYEIYHKPSKNNRNDSTWHSWGMALLINDQLILCDHSVFSLWLCPCNLSLRVYEILLGIKAKFWYTLNLYFLMFLNDIETQFAAKDTCTLYEQKSSMNYFLLVLYYDASFSILFLLSLIH